MNAAALIAAAAGVRVWPRGSDLPESVALAELIAAQVVGSALLFPIVLRGAGTAVVNLILIATFQQLAGLLSATPPVRVAIASLYVATWAAGLAGWARLATTEVRRSWAVCAAVVLSTGGAVLWYLAAEATAQRGSDAPAFQFFGAILGATSQTARSGQIGTLFAWFVAALPLGSTAVWVVITRTSRSKNVAPLPSTEGVSSPKSLSETPRLEGEMPPT